MSPQKENRKQKQKFKGNNNLIEENTISNTSSAEDTIVKNVRQCNSRGRTAERTKRNSQDTSSSHSQSRRLASNVQVNEKSELKFTRYKINLDDLKVYSPIIPIQELQVPKYEKELSVLETKKSKKSTKNQRVNKIIRVTRQLRKRPAKRKLAHDNFSDEEKNFSLPEPTEETPILPLTKEQFFMALNLIPKDLAPVNVTVDHNQQALNRTVRSRRIKNESQKVANYFLRNQIPIASERGKRFISSTNSGILKNPEAAAIAVDQLCSTDPTPVAESRKRKTKLVPVKVSKKMQFKKYQYVHQLPLGPRDRKLRYLELKAGVKARHFPLLKKCKPFSIVMEKSSEEFLARFKREPPSYGNVPIKECKVVLKDLANFCTGRILLHRAEKRAYRLRLLKFKGG